MKKGLKRVPGSLAAAHAAEAASSLPAPLMKFWNRYRPESCGGGAATSGGGLGGAGIASGVGAVAAAAGDRKSVV